MISIEKARSGHPILKKDGRYLGSSFDPIKEARTWAAKTSGQICGYPVAVILGMGSGYHLQEIAALRPDLHIYIVDFDPDLVTQALSLIESRASVTSLVAETAEKILQMSETADLLASVYRILKHPISYHMSPEFFLSVEELLIGRTTDAFRKQLRLRPELERVIDASGLDKGDGQLLSVKSVNRLWDREYGRRISEEEAKWRLLKELVL